MIANDIVPGMVIVFDTPFPEQKTITSVENCPTEKGNVHINHSECWNRQQPVRIVNYEKKSRKGKRNVDRG